MSHTDRTQQRARREGMAAHTDGQSRDSCPYHSRAKLRDCWLQGWDSVPTRVPVNGHYDIVDTPSPRRADIRFY